MQSGGSGVLPIASGSTPTSSLEFFGAFLFSVGSGFSHNSTGSTPIAYPEHLSFFGKKSIPILSLPSFGKEAAEFFFAGIVSGIIKQSAFDFLGEEFLGNKIVWVIMGVPID